MPNHLPESDSNVPEETTTEITTEPTTPSTSEGWQKYVATLPVKDVLALLNEDKARANRLLSGFRPSSDTLKNPRVAGRIAEEAMKQPKFAESLLALSPKPATKPALPPKTSAATPARDIENLKKEIQILREALDKRKATIQAKELELRESKATLIRTEQERDMAKRVLQQARDAQEHAEQEAERLRHQLRRTEEKGKKDKESLSHPMVESPRPSPPTPSKITSSLPIVPRPSPLSEGAQRLLRRGRFAAVVELCRETLNIDSVKENSLERGQIQALYATALYGQGQIPQGEEQSRLAIPTLLDGGDILGAAEASTRFLSEAKTVRKTDGEPLRRLAMLAKRAAREDEVGDYFRQLRLRSRVGYQRLVELLGNAGKGILPESTNTEQFGPDQTIVLPTYNVIPVTPRRIVHAVDTNESELIRSVRQGLSTLRHTGITEARRVDAFLEAVATLDPFAVEPLLRTHTNAVIVDASNVARFNPDPLAFAPPPHTEHLRLMRDFLLRSGFFPVLMIADANLVHKIDDRVTYQNLLAREIVREVPAGTNADDELVRQALLWHAPIVTNDTFSDREDSIEITRLAFHIGGGTIGLMHR